MSQNPYPVFFPFDITLLSWSGPVVGPASQSHLESPITPSVMRVAGGLWFAPTPLGLVALSDPLLYAGQTGGAGVQWSELSCRLITNV